MSPRNTEEQNHLYHIAKGYIFAYAKFIDGPVCWWKIQRVLDYTNKMFVSEAWGVETPDGANTNIQI